MPPHAAVGRCRVVECRVTSPRSLAHADASCPLIACSGPAWPGHRKNPPPASPAMIALSHGRTRCSPARFEILPLLVFGSGPRRPMCIDVDASALPRRSTGVAGDRPPADAATRRAGVGAAGACRAGRRGRTPCCGRGRSRAAGARAGGPCRPGSTRRVPLVSGTHGHGPDRRHHEAARGVAGASCPARGWWQRCHSGSGKDHAKADVIEAQIAKSANRATRHTGRIGRV